MMLKPIIQALTQPCKDQADHSNYFAEYSIDSPVLQLSVDGVEKIDFPLSLETIQRLLNISEQAQFGWRDKTLTDKAVRDTQEIASQHLKVQLDDQFITSLLSQAKQQLGLPNHANLSTHLHNLLIYGPGQFFKPHRDSEKLDGMVATLVIVLPSPHIGGDLLIHHKKEKHRFVSENLNQSGLNCVVFYADCTHEVEKIKQGYRVALTYNIVLESADISDRFPKNKALHTALKQYFDLPQSSHLDTNLIYYLDHSYTEHSLRWDLLKGNDYHHVCEFLQAAKELNLVPHLALVEIHQSWTTDGDDDDPTPEELIDDSTCLNFWVDAHNQSVDYKNYYADESEECWLTATEDLEPDEIEHEGWMGNYGNTVDYWYRRAAIVLWPKNAQVRMDFRLNYEKAIENIFQLSKVPGHEQEILAIIEHAHEYFHQSSHDSDIPSLSKYLQLALYVQCKETALFIDLQGQYGVQWCLSLLEQAKNKVTSRYRESHLIKDFSALIHSLTAIEIDPALIVFLIKYQLDALIQRNDRWKHSRPVELKESFHVREDIFDDVFKALVELNHVQFINQLIQYVVSNTKLYPNIALAPFLIKWQDNANFQKTAGYESLRIHIEAAIQQELSRGLRNEHDQSIDQRLSCKCEYCDSTNIFLQSETESIKIFAVRQDLRQHIMDNCSGLGLPVTFTEERKGSPYRLIIEKNKDLFQLAKTRFTTLKIYQNKLSTTQNADV